MQQDNRESIFKKPSIFKSPSITSEQKESIFKKPSIFSKPKPKANPHNPRNGLSKAQIAEAEATRDSWKAQDKKYGREDDFINTTSHNSFYKGFTHNMDEYGASINKGLGKVMGAVGLDGAKKSLDKRAEWWSDQRRMNEIETENAGISKIAGQMLLDPVNLTPAGVISKGTKLARVGKSMVAGAGVGYATSKAKNYGNDDLTDKQKKDEDMMSAGIVSVLNGIIAGVTRGRVTNALKDVDVPTTKVDEATGKTVPLTQDEGIKATLNNPKEFGLSDVEATAVANEYQKMLRNNSDFQNSLAKNEVLDDVVEQTDDIFAHPRAKEAIDMARERYASQTHNDRVGGGSASWMDENHVYHRAGAKGEKNYHQGFELSKADIKKLDAGNITPEIEAKLRNDVDRLENDPNWNTEVTTNQETHIDADGELIDTATGEAIFTNAGHNLAGGFGVGTANAGGGLFDGSYDKNRPLSDQMAERFLNGFIAGAVGVSGLKLLRKTNPEAFGKVQKWFTDNDVKVGDKLPTEGVQIGVFAGNRAKGFDGKATHAGKYDGQTRFEIDDSKMEVVPTGVTELASKGYTGLDKIIKHDELFENYPQLRNVVVKFDKNMKEHASFDGESTITLSNKFKNKDEMSSSIIHEIQHWVQNKEGFAGGGNFDDMLRQVNGKIYDLEAKGNLSALDALNYKKDLDYLKDNKSAEAFDRYKNIAGEIEAREVQARKNLTPEERGLIPNYENADTMITGHGDEAYNSAFMAKLEGRHGDFDSTGIKSNDATLDFSRNRADSIEVKQSLRGIVREATSTNKKRNINLGSFSDEAVKRVQEDTGLNIGAYSSLLTSDSIRHVKNRHPEDLDLIEEIPNIINNFDMAKKSLTRDRQTGKTNVSIEFFKKMDDGVVKVVELRNLNDKTLEFKTLFRDGADQKLLRELQMSPRYKSRSHPSGYTSKTHSDGFSDTSIPQTPKNPNMRDGFVKIPESNDGFLSHNFDDLEKKATANANKDWRDVSQNNSTLKNLQNGLNYAFRDSMSGEYHGIRDITHTNLQKSDNALANLGKVLDELDETTDKELFHYLIKESDGKNLPDNVKKMGDMIRYTIDKKSRELVAKGILDKESVDEWLGSYLHRMFQPRIDKKIGHSIGGNFKMDKNFERGDPKTFKNTDLKGISGWLNKNGFLDDADLMKLKSIDDLKKHLGDTDNIGMLRDGKLKLTDLGSEIRLKRDWSKAEREAMGEVQSAKVTVLETLARMNKLEQHAEFLERAANVEGVIANKMMVKNSSHTELERAGFYKLDSNPQLGAMSGKWARRDVADDIDRTTKDVMHIHDEWFNKWNAGHGLWKKSKTVWNPTAHANNFTGNLFLMHLSGVNGLRIGQVLNNGRKGMMALKRVEELEYRGLKNGLTQKEKIELKDLKNVGKFAIEAKNNGIFGRSQLNDILAGMEQNSNRTSLLGKIDQFLSKAYQAEDNFNRLSFYLTLRESGKDSKTAKQMVDFMLPDYTKPLPKGWRFLRDSSIAPFISWSYYTMPSIVKMMVTKRGAMKVTTILGLLSTMEYLASNGEITPLDNLPWMGDKKPEDFKGRRFVYGKDGDKYNTIKLDRMIPYAELQSIPNYINGLANGIVPNLAYTMRGKQLYGGRPITYKNKSAGDKAIDWLKHLASQYTPIPVPAMNAINAVDSAARSKKKRKRNNVVIPRNSVQDILKNVGINTMSFSKSGLKREERKH